MSRGLGRSLLALALGLGAVTAIQNGKSLEDRDTAAEVVRDAGIGQSVDALHEVIQGLMDAATYKPQPINQGSQFQPYYEAGNGTTEAACTTCLSPEVVQTTSPADALPVPPEPTTTRAPEPTIVYGPMDSDVSTAVSTTDLLPVPVPPEPTTTRAPEPTIVYGPAESAVSTADALPVPPKPTTTMAPEPTIVEVPDVQYNTSTTTTDALPVPTEPTTTMAPEPTMVDVPGVQYNTSTTTTDTLPVLIEPTTTRAPEPTIAELPGVQYTTPNTRVIGMCSTGLCHLVNPVQTMRSQASLNLPAANSTTSSAFPTYNSPRVEQTQASLDTGGYKSNAAHLEKPQSNLSMPSSTVERPDLKTLAQPTRQSNSSLSLPDHKILTQSTRQSNYSHSLPDSTTSSVFNLPSTTPLPETLTQSTRQSNSSYALPDQKTLAQSIPQSNSSYSLPGFTTSSVVHHPSRTRLYTYHPETPKPSTFETVRSDTTGSSPATRVVHETITSSTTSSVPTTPVVTTRVVRETLTIGTTVFVETTRAVVYVKGDVLRTTLVEPLRVEDGKETATGLPTSTPGVGSDGNADSDDDANGTPTPVFWISTPFWPTGSAPERLEASVLWLSMGLLAAVALL